MIRILLLLFLTSSVITGTFAQTITSSGAGSGAWNDPLSWSPNTVPTTANSTSVLIANGHSINISANLSIDQVDIQSGGVLIVDPSIVLTLANGLGDEITVDAGGTLTNNGTIAFGALPLRTVVVNGSFNNNGAFTGVNSSKLTFNGGSNYFHQFANGGTIPAASWNSNSTINIVGYTSGNSLAPAGLNQTFGNFVWNAPNQDVTISLGGLPTSINGDFRVINTGIDVLFYSFGGAGNTFNIGGSVEVTGGILGFATGDAGPSIWNIAGNLEVADAFVQIADDQNLTANIAGDFILTGSGQIDLAATTGIGNVNLQGNYTHTGGALFVGGSSGNINFTGASTKIFTSTIIPAGNVNYSIASLSTVTLSGSNFIGGGGSFTLNGTLQVGSTDSGGALQTGTSNGNLRISGTRTFASNSNIVYNGSGAQFIGNGFPSGSDVNLTINNASGVTLSTSLDIVALRTLTLASGNLSIGAQTLTINGTVTGSGGLVGGASSNLSIGGTGNFGTLTFNGTTQLNNFTLNRTGGSGLVTLGGNLTILGAFTHTAGTLAVGSNTLTISGAFGPSTPDQLSTTSASTIIIDGSGNLPTDVALTGSALGTFTMARASTNFPTNSTTTITNLNLNDGTFGNGSGIAMAVGGTVTRSGGSMSSLFSNTVDAYNVVYTNGTISSGPELPSNVTALANLSKTGAGTLTLGKSITINGSLTLSSGSFNAGSNAIDIKGDFISNGGSTLTASTLTFSGTTTISGSSTPTFGAITITGILTPNTNFQINGNLINNGTLNVGSATTTFGGITAISGSSISSFNNIIIAGSLTAPASFNVAGSWTNNGTFTRGATSNTVTFTGISSIAGSSPTTFSSITISGTLNAPTNLMLAGNFTNNGIFNSGTGTVTFEGSSTQSILGSVVTNFNNITITNTAGPPAVQVQSNQNLNGVLTLSSNSQFDADGSAGTAIFTLVSSADAPTSDASIAAIPSGASVTGNVTVQRYMAIEGANSSRIYRYISSPVQSAPVSQIQSEIPVTGSFTGTSTCTGCGSAQSMFLYNESIITDTNGSGGNNFDDGYEDFPSVANSETLTEGRGYTIFVRGNVNPVASNGSARWDVRAPINSGTINFNAFTTFTSSGTLANDGWNLVGNPYPATIDWDAAGWTKTGINNALYLRDNGLASPLYATYIAGVGVNGGSRYIATGQAFFVKSDGGPIDFQATESVKAAGTQTTFFREGAIDDILRVALKNGNITDETVVRFDPAASDNFDPSLDAYKLKNAVFNLSSVSNEIQYAINALPKLDCSTSVSLNVSNAELGSYNLLFSEFESFDETMEIQLTDKFLGQTINIRNQFDYQFEVTSDQNSQGKRFTLVFALASVDVSILPEGPSTLCGNASYSIVLPTSESGVAYYASLNGTTISDNIVGTGNTLAIGIDEAKLVLGENNILIYAKLATCDAVPLMEALSVTRDNIYQIQSVSGNTACQQGSVTLSASGAPENGSYHWYESLTATEPISGVSGKTFTTPLLDKTKTYYVTAVNAIGCEGERTEIKAEVIKYDEILITETTYGVLSSSYTTGNTWYVNDVLIPGAKSQSITVTESGVYRVEVAIGNCKTTDSYEFVVTGIEGKDDGIEIYPNPVQEELTIQGLRNVHAIELISNTGLLVKAQAVKETSVTMDMKNYPAGLYLVKLLGANNSVSTFKVIKK